MLSLLIWLICFRFIIICADGWIKRYAWSKCPCYAWVISLSLAKGKYPMSSEVAHLNLIKAVKGSHLVFNVTHERTSLAELDGLRKSWICCLRRSLKAKNVSRLGWLEKSSSSIHTMGKRQKIPKLASFWTVETKLNLISNIHAVMV